MQKEAPDVWTWMKPWLRVWLLFRTMGRISSLKGGGQALEQAAQGGVGVHISRNAPHPQKQSRNIWTWHLVLYGLVDMVVLFGQRLDLILEVFPNDSKCVFNLSHPVGLQYPVFLLSPLTCCCLQMPSTNYGVIPASSWSLVYNIHVENYSSLALSLRQLH